VLRTQSVDPTETASDGMARYHKAARSRRFGKPAELHRLVDRALHVVLVHRPDLACGLVNAAEHETDLACAEVGVPVRGVRPERQAGDSEPSWQSSIPSTFVPD